MARAIGAHDAGVETMPGIRCADATQLFLAIERQRIRAQILAPEALLEGIAQPLRLPSQIRRECVLLGNDTREIGRRGLGGIDVALHFA